MRETKGSAPRLHLSLIHRQSNRTLSASLCVVRTNRRIQKKFKVQMVTQYIYLASFVPWETAFASTILLINVVVRYGSIC